jgi:hypothetical protein
MSARMLPSAASAKRATALCSSVTPAGKRPAAAVIAACKGPCVLASKGECRVASSTSACRPSATNCPSTTSSPPARAASSRRSCPGYSSSGSVGATRFTICPVGRPSSCFNAAAAARSPASDNLSPKPFGSSSSR